MLKPIVLTRSAPAKINLGLHVRRRRPDGFHDLETVFLPVPWADELTVERAPEVSMTCSHPALPVDGRNLCIRAAEVLRREAGTDAGAAIHLEKHIPYGAGLGGGSSDAASTLILLDRLWRLHLPKDRLHAVAAALGSDVPFFLGDSTAYATGRGERLEPLLDGDTGEAYRLPFSLVVVVPPVEVATAEAYGLVTPLDEGLPDLREVVRSNDLVRWREELVNHFQAPIFSRYPAVADAAAMLRSAGADYVSLSGSGSAVYGVFEDASEAMGAAEAARLNGLASWHGLEP